MTKQEIMKRLRIAKSAHLQWRARAQALVAGIELDDEKVPIIHTDCKFGQWYYGDGQDLASLPSFQAIEKPHEILHAIYMKIFKTLHGDDERSTLQKLFGKKSNFKQKQLEKSKEYLNELIEISKTLLMAIEQLENELKSMTDSEIEKLCC